MSDFNTTLFEACELLNRSKKSISRYIRRGLLHPKRVKSKQGTLEYRFSKADIEAFKAQEAPKADETEQTGHPEPTSKKPQNSGELVEKDKTRPDETRGTGQDNEVITLLKETTGLLRDQLKTKDEQIKDLGGKIDQLIERDRETNILLKGLQDKVLMLGQGKSEPTNTSEPEETEQTAQDEPQEATPELTETNQDKQEETTNQVTPEPVKAGFWERLFKGD